MERPNTEKISYDGQNEYITFASSTMQGYRLGQEDALNCCADFDINSSLFAVYDGHGGAEVALYCAQKLPDFLKSMEAYQKGNFEEAFKDAFIRFDSTLTEVAVIEELKKIATDVGRGSERKDNVDSEVTLAKSSTEQDKNLNAELEKCKDKTNAANSKVLSPKLSRNRRLCADADFGTDDDDDDDDDDEHDERPYGEGYHEETNNKRNLEEEEESEADYDEYLYDDELDNTPGYSSGCTAVVALLVDRELHVANAGDSRCVLCRSGKAVEMSVDHKPEDAEESLRITKAGGSVTDGRVEGGLNLSRAIGDHLYKLNDDLKPEEQMISPMPDVKAITLQGDDEFMVLASDGIWNCMTSEEVVEFVRERLTQKREKLSSICEELFTKCLEPNADGDIPGCDNMTAVLIQFKQNLQRTDNETAANKTRAVSPVFVSPDNEVHKRLKVND